RLLRRAGGGPRLERGANVFPGSARTAESFDGDDAGYIAIARGCGCRAGPSDIVRKLRGSGLRFGDCVSRLAGAGGRAAARDGNAYRVGQAAGAGGAGKPV